MRMCTLIGKRRMSMGLCFHIRWHRMERACRQTMARHTEWMDESALSSWRESSPHVLPLCLCLMKRNPAQSRRNARGDPLSRLYHNNFFSTSLSDFLLLLLLFPFLHFCFHHRRLHTGNKILKFHYLCELHLRSPNDERNSSSGVKWHRHCSIAIYLLIVWHRSTDRYR